MSHDQLLIFHLIVAQTDTLQTRHTPSTRTSQPLIRKLSSSYPSVPREISSLLLRSAESSLEQHVRLWNNTLNIYSQPKNLRPHITTDLPTCIACGSILRSLQRLHKPVPDACKKCFKEHCWDGKEDHSQPGFLAPALLYDPEVSFAQWNASFYASATTNSTGNSSSSGL